MLVLGGGLFAFFFLLDILFLPLLVCFRSKEMSHFDLPFLQCFAGFSSVSILRGLFLPEVLFFRVHVFL